MAIAYGISKVALINPGGANFITTNVTCTAGSDTALFVVVIMNNTRTLASATYDGTTMQKTATVNYGSLSQTSRGFWLPTTNSTGSAKTLRINFSGSNWGGSVSVMAMSFTGISATIPTQAANGLSSSPHSQTIAVDQGGVIYAAGISGYAQSYGYIINGSTRTNIIAGHNTNKIVEGAWSALNLPAGNITVSTKADASTVTNTRWSLGAGGSSSSSRRRIIIS